MTESEINVAISELLGWSHIENANTMAMDGHWRGYPPKGAIVGRKAPLPNFCDDLNVMRVAADTLPQTRRGQYNAELSLIATGRNLSAAVNEPEFIYQLLHASSRHRARAFLRVHGIDPG